VQRYSGETAWRHAISIGQRYDRYVSPYAMAGRGLHYRKDVVFGEDRCQARLGAGPMILATLRDTALSLLHTIGCRNVAARLRHYGQYPGAAVALFHRPRIQNA